jgi:hypothetical protein
LAEALQSTERLMKHSGIVFVLSDFMAEDYETPLKRLARKHDVVALKVTDTFEDHFPEVGTVWLVDPETGREVSVNAASSLFQAWFKKWKTEFEEKQSSQLKGTKLEVVPLRSQEDYIEAVVKFFRARARRRR